MIAKGKAISHGANAINYALREGKIDMIVGRNMIEGDSPADILREFEMVNHYNQRCKNKYLRFEIGIAPQDMGKLSLGDMSRISHLFAHKLGLENQQWFACTHEDTGKPHIHLIANRIGIDSSVFDTTFISNRASRVAEEISRELGLTIANEVRKQSQYEKKYSDPLRQKAKEKLQQIAYLELRNNNSLEGFLYALERRGVGIETARNKQGKAYGVRFVYDGQTFKASEIGREFGFGSLAKNFASLKEQSCGVRNQSSLSGRGGSESWSSSESTKSNKSSSVASLLSDLIALGNSTKSHSDDYNGLHRKKKRKKRRYGRQL